MIEGDEEHELVLFFNVVLSGPETDLRQIAQTIHNACCIVYDPTKPIQCLHSQFECNPEHGLKPLVVKLL